MAKYTFELKIGIVKDICLALRSMMPRNNTASAKAITLMMYKTPILRQGQIEVIIMILSQKED